MTQVHNIKECRYFLAHLTEEATFGSLDMALRMFLQRTETEWQKGFDAGRQYERDPINKIPWDLHIGFRGGY